MVKYQTFSLNDQMQESMFATDYDAFLHSLIRHWALLGLSTPSTITLGVAPSNRHGLVDDCSLLIVVAWLVIVVHSIIVAWSMIAVHSIVMAWLVIAVHSIRGSGGKNVIFKIGPNSTSECFNLFY
jgi:hypothetical protein